MDPDCRGAGHVHDLPRQQHRERGPSRDATRTPSVGGRTGMGRQCLHSGVRRTAVGGWAPGRRVRATPALSDWARDLHLFIARCRAIQ